MGERYRHEWKHIISPADLVTIRQRLRAVAEPDRNAVNGKYLIRSLYFDDPTDRALREKIDGVNRREKFRIRSYNMDPDFIRLEKKSKLNGLGTKHQAVMTAEQTLDCIEGRIGWMLNEPQPLIQELYCKMKNQGLRPKVIVDYIREPFIFVPGNVRVTLDHNIRTALRCTDFLNPECITIPIPDDPIILEVKWDDFLPDIIKGAVQLPGRRVTAFSKYAQCRVYE